MLLYMDVKPITTWSISLGIADFTSESLSTLKMFIHPPAEMQRRRGKTNIDNLESPTPQRLCAFAGDKIGPSNLLFFNEKD